MHTHRFIISGGGSGGHIFPAIAIADELKERFPEAEILFVGAKGKMEMSKVPKAGYEIIGLNVVGLKRSLTWTNLLFPFRLLLSLNEARRIIRSFKPDVVIGVGGYASAPTVALASLMRVRTLIQEQNSYPGITNRLLGKKAAAICTAYDNLEQYFPLEKTVKTGNPVRQDILDVANKREEAQEFFKLKSDQKTVLVFGGSLGARRINQLMETFADFFEKQQIQLIWQTGSLYYEEYKKFDNEYVQTHEFLNRMDLAYAAADVIISRAGAISVSELCIVGKPVIFIPSPNVAENHQAKNAMTIANENAAYVLDEKDLAKEFQETIQLVLGSEKVRKDLSDNIKKLALPGATSAIVDTMERILNN